MVRTKIGEERIFTINLRKQVEKVPRYKRTSKAVRTLKEYVIKHMKCDNVLIGKYLNLEIWKNGMKNPPLKLQVKAIKEEIEKKNKKKVEVVKVEIVGAPEEEIKVEKKKGLVDKFKAKVGGGESKTIIKKDSKEKKDETSKPIVKKKVLLEKIDSKK